MFRFVSELLPASFSTIKPIKIEAKENQTEKATKNREGGSSCSDTQDKHRKRKKTMNSLNGFNKSEVRRTVHNFYVTDKTVATINKKIKKMKIRDRCGMEVG